MADQTNILIQRKIKGEAMISLIIIILISLAIGVLFLSVTPENPVNFFIFGFAAFGILIALRSGITSIVKMIKRFKMPKEISIEND